MNRPPPIITPSATAYRAKGGGGWKVFAIILIVLLGLSLLLNLGHVAGSGGGKLKSYRATATGPRLDEVVLRDSSSSDKIAVIPVDGVISGSAIDGGNYSMVTLIKEQLKLARTDSSVKAVILKVDSPGGEVLAADDIAKALRDFHERSGKPVIVSMGSLAASGGYYVSAPCQWIVANELTITGSIGVIMEGLNYRGLLDKVGVRPEVFKSGKFKDMLSPVKSPEETTDEEKQMVQSLIDETFARFKKVVQDGRDAAYKSQPHNEGDPKISHGLSDRWMDYADGRILSGTVARDLGFVDELGDFDVAVDRAKKLSGIGSAVIVEYQPVFDISSLFGRLLGKTDAKAVKIDLGIEAPKVQAGYLYFLSPTYLQ